MTTSIAEETAAMPDQLPADREQLVALMREVYQEQKKAEGKQFLTIDQMKQEFLRLPGEEYRDYEVKVTGFARDWADFLIRRASKDDPEPPILQLLPKPGQELDYGSDEEKIAFAAFAVAINYERLHKNPREEKALLETYRKFFGKKNQNSTGAADTYEHVYFFHLDVLSRMDMAVGGSDEFL